MNKVEVSNLKPADGERRDAGWSCGPKAEETLLVTALLCLVGGTIEMPGQLRVEAEVSPVQAEGRDSITSRHEEEGPCTPSHTHVQRTDTPTTAVTETPAGEAGNEEILRGAAEQEGFLGDLLAGGHSQQHEVKGQVLLQGGALSANLATANHAPEAGSQVDGTGEQRTSRGHDGPLEVGEDAMVINGNSDKLASETASPVVIKTDRPVPKEQEEEAEAAEGQAEVEDSEEQEEEKVTDGEALEEAGEDGQEENGLEDDMEQAEVGQDSLADLAKRIQVEEVRRPTASVMFSAIIIAQAEVFSVTLWYRCCRGEHSCIVSDYTDIL